MTQDSIKKVVKPKTGRLPVEKKNSETQVVEKSPVKSVPQETAVKRAHVKKPASSQVAGGKIKVTQMVGCIARRRDQEATLIGLGLNKRHRSRVLEDTPCVRGMIYKVRHLVRVENA